MSLTSMARVTCFMSSLTWMFGRNPIPLLSNRVGKTLRWHSIAPCPAFQQIPPQWGFYGLG